MTNLVSEQNLYVCFPEVSIYISFPSVIIVSIGASRHILKFLLRCIKLQCRLNPKIVVTFGV